MAPHVLAHRAYRALFLAALASNVGTFIQDVGEAWLMVSLGGSPLQIALVSATTWLPAIVVTLPAGALADQVDRRKLIALAQSWMLATCAALALATSLQRVTPSGLLMATTALGIGSALSGPAWTTILPDLVPLEQLGDAIALQSLNWNIARAVGPALGGLVVARLGPSAAFALNAASFIGVVVVVLRSPRAPTAASREPVATAVAAGLRYVRERRDLRALMVSIALYGLFAAPFLALLPALVARELGLESASFGVLLGCFGAGALVGATSLRRARARFHTATLLPSLMLVSGSALLAASRASSLPLAAAAAVPAGAAWLMILSTENTLVQLSTPAELRGRVKAVDNLLFLGSVAAGSTLSGLLANRLGVRVVLSACGAGVLLAALVARASRLPSHPPPRSAEEGETPEG